MSDKPKSTDAPDLNSLAIEACDMWQEHLSNLANDPNARAELTRFLEPQRRLFADWAGMMQQGLKSGGIADVAPGTQKPRESATGAPEHAPPRGHASGDDPLRTAQLALRMGELEKRIAELEARLAGTPRRAQRPSS